MSVGHTRSYSTTLLPGLFGLGMGVAITSIFLGDDALARLYLRLPEFEIWRGAMIVQVTVYIGVAAYLIDVRGDPWLPRLTPRQTGLIAALTVSAVALPSLMVRVRNFPLQSQAPRIWVVVIAAVAAMVLLTNRLARIHAALADARDPNAHRQLRRATQDLLTIAAATVTLGTLGTGILQTSLEAMAGAAAFAETPFQYVAELNRGHVLAFGAYFAVLLLVFFAPIFSAERDSAKRLSDRLEADESSAVAGSALPSDLNLEASLVQRLAAAFGVLAPLMGAIVSQLMP